MYSHQPCPVVLPSKSICYLSVKIKYCGHTLTKTYTHKWQLSSRAHANSLSGRFETRRLPLQHTPLCHRLPFLSGSRCGAQRGAAAAETTVVVAAQGRLQHCIQSKSKGRSSCKLHYSHIKPGTLSI